MMNGTAMDKTRNSDFCQREREVSTLVARAAARWRNQVNCTPVTRAPARDRRAVNCALFCGVFALLSVAPPSQSIIMIRCLLLLVLLGAIVVITATFSRRKYLAAAVWPAAKLPKKRRNRLAHLRFCLSSTGGRARPKDENKK